MDAFYLPTRHGRRFCVLHGAAGADRARGAILYIHPFGEEMNKARRMAALQSRAFAHAGYDVLLIDLHGCGDSAGEFRDATWAIWMDDVRTAHEWLAQRTDTSPWLWGLRTGCLLATALAHADGAPAKLLLWQPIHSGRRFLQQFLRMRLARDALSNGDRAAPREVLTQNGEIEISGYRLGAALAEDLDRMQLQAPPAGSEAHWFDVQAADGDTNAHALREVQAWNERDCRTTVNTVVGMPFWQTQEINECPALITSTLSAMPQ